MHTWPNVGLVTPGRVVFVIPAALALLNLFPSAKLG